MNQVCVLQSAASYVTPQHGVPYYSYITVRDDDRPTDPPPVA